MSARGLPHFARGLVVKGFGRGSKELGIPTANLPAEEVSNLPAELNTGVYFGWARVDNGPVYKMVMSIGWNPYYKNKEKSMEIHILNVFEKDFYGCTKCRHLLFCHPEITLYTAHEESCTNLSVKYDGCQTIQEDNVWFLQDSNLPPWMTGVVDKSGWTKGKVNCPNCQGRLGSFDFVSGTQCQCGSHVLPPVHIVKCKVDCRNL